jgi:Xaa-Pro aminopeptidase
MLKEAGAASLFCDESASLIRTLNLPATLLVRDVSTIVQNLRLKKSPLEIEQMQYISSLSADALTETIAYTRPGMNERVIHVSPPNTF